MHSYKTKAHLNSLEDCKSLASLRRMTRSFGSISSSQTNDKWCRSYSDFKTSDENTEMEEDIHEPSESEFLTIKTSARSLRHIEDYKQFIAARTIQRFVRGWLARRKYAKFRKAALIIQSAWRCFHQQRKFVLLLEESLQKQVENYFHKSATKIQALFRGWWVRHNIHDNTYLMRLQMTAGEDLLHCIAFKLHHLIRTHTIPGVFSLKNTTALSKVEELLAGMTFNQCNDRARWLKRQHQLEINENKKQFKKSQYGSKLPYAGPNIYNTCEPKCLPVYSEVDADRKMIKILKMFEEAAKQDSRVKRMKSSKNVPSKPKSITSIALLPNTFCGDIIRSMRKWKILKEQKFTVPPNVLDKPSNVEKFLSEMKFMWNAVHRPCHCEQDYAETRKREEEANRKKRNNDAEMVLPHCKPLLNLK